MAREKKFYRDNLELLNTRFPKHDMLSIRDVMDVTGFQTRERVMRHLGERFQGTVISKAALADWMCG